jgi:predicted metal-dependent hydrolase
MKPRKPGLEFQDTPPHWCANPEVAQINNAGSFSLPYVEKYLNRVMLRAKETLTGERHARLRDDIDLFIKQESNHYRQHRLFNNRLEALGYTGVTPVGEQLGKDYKDFLANRSLLFNAAYCEGFESIGIIQTEFFFEQIDDLLAGADPRVVALWKWHLAEEYEHRSVCFEVHRAVHGGFSYFSRLGGFFLAIRHLGKFGKDASDALLAADRAAMTPEQLKASLKSEKIYRRRLSRFALPRLLKVLSPFYNPMEKREPKGAAAFLLQYE